MAHNKVQVSATGLVIYFVVCWVALVAALYLTTKRDSVVSYGMLTGETTAKSGAEVFDQQCRLCHSIGKGKLVGPDLANVQKRRSEDWLLRFIASSQTVIASGDPDAVALFEEYQKTLMPNSGLSDDVIRSVIEYIANESPDDGSTDMVQTVQVDSKVDSTRALAGETKVPGDELPGFDLTDIETGQKIFEGRIALINGGPSCISCHHVNHESVFAGGLVAKNLTGAVSRLSLEGVTGILKNPPFPAMQTTYTADKKLTESEVHSLTGFLQQMDKAGSVEAGSTRGQGRFLIAGFGGTVVLLVFFGFVWTKRKTKSVNDGIYRRQIESE